MKLRCIVVGVDGSPKAQAAFDWAADVAAGAGAELVAVHATGLLEGQDLRVTDAAEQPGMGDLAAGAGRRVVSDGDAVGVLLRTAEEMDADLIVVGSRGMGGRPELLLGSTSTQVAQRSTRPVVIVPSVG